MDYISGERMVGKSFKICKIEPTVKKTDKNADKGAQQMRVIKKMIGILLLVLAGVFSGAVVRMSAAAAFLTVFLYICVQVWMWVDAPEK